MNSLPGVSAQDIGRLVGGRHRLEAHVGQGPLGPVFRARDEQDDAPVAVELARDAAAFDPGLPARLVAAVDAARDVRHPGLVRLVEAGEDAGRAFVARAWIDGSDLGHRYAAGPPEPAEALEVLEQVAGALDAAHAAGQVHGDLGPAVVLVRDTPGGPRAYLTGLGVRRALLAAGIGPTLTLGSDTAGLPGALAPELASGAEPDARADVYGLACLAFEVLSGTPPFTGPTAAAVLTAHTSRPRPRVTGRRAALPPALDPVLEAGMALDPALRPQSAGALVAALHEALDGDVTVEDATFIPGRPVVPVVAAPAHVAPRRRRRGGGVLVGALLAVALVGGGLGGVALATSDDAPAAAMDMPTLTTPPRLQRSTILPQRPPSAPGPQAQAAVAETLRQFLDANVEDEGLDTTWSFGVSPALVGEEPDAKGTCVRTATPKPGVSFKQSPGRAWLERRRASRVLPVAFPGLKPAQVRFENPRLASWEGIAVNRDGGRRRIRAWYTRDGMGATWLLAYLDLCPGTAAA